MIITGPLDSRGRYYKGNSTSDNLNLLEDLAISPWVILSVNSNRLLPGPLLVDELLVLRFGVVKFGELVALIVWCDIESWQSLLATDDKSTLDDRVICDPVNGSTSEDILARSLKTSEEATDQVRSHENLSKLIIVLVIDLPDRVLLGIVVLPEPLERNGSVVVRVLTLPLIERQGCLG
jgi:hypothetical protein